MKTAPILNTSHFIEANSRGLEIIRMALRIHGDIKDPDLKLSISIKTLDGIHRGQSLVPEPPYERYLLETRFYIDRPNRKEIMHTMNNFAGFNFESITIISPESSRNYNLMTEKYSNVTTLGFNNFRYLPDTYLKAALANAKTVYYEKEVLIDGEKMHQISAGTGSAARRLYFDLEQGYLRRVETLRNYEPYGDGTSIKTFSDFNRFGNVHLPRTIYSGGNYGAWGEAGNVFTLKVIDSTKKAPTHLQMKDFELADYSDIKKNKLIQLAHNIYMIQNITSNTDGDDYNILFVEFDDYILVGEAPVNANISKEAMKHMSFVSNKPIKYLVQSHHHNDHWGGIREYISVGATIITGEKNQPLLKKIAKAPFALRSDSQWNSPKSLSVLGIDTSMEIKDTSTKAVIYDIGPMDHANEMLIIYFPKHGILWQADLISYGEWGLEANRTKYLVQKIKELNLDVKIIAGVHGKIMRGDTLKKLLSF